MDSVWDTRRETCLKYAYPPLAALPPKAKIIGAMLFSIPVQVEDRNAVYDGTELGGGEQSQSEVLCVHNDQFIHYRPLRLVQLHDGYSGT